MVDSVEIYHLRAVFIFNFYRELRKKRADTLRVLRVNAVLLYEKSYRAIESAGVNVEYIKLFGNCLSDSAFSRSSGTVDSDMKHKPP